MKTQTGYVVVTSWLGTRRESAPLRYREDASRLVLAVTVNGYPAWVRPVHAPAQTGKDQ